MLYEFGISTARQSFHMITGNVKAVLAESGVRDGICVVYCPHTTAGITINENADPDVRHDLVLAMDGAFPDRAAFLHGEGNSAAHAKTLCTGASVTIPVMNGKLLLGTWQGIYFAEYDGPRQRRYYVKILEG